MTRAFALAAVFAVASAGGPAGAAAAPVLLPGEGTPPAVTALGAPDGIEALAVSADGAVAVAVVPSAKTPGRWSLRIVREDLVPADVELDGTAQGLALTAAGDAAFAVVRAVDKKGAVRRTSLVSVDPATRRLVEVASLPATSRGLALAPGDAALWVAAKDEVRSFTRPGLASGPLYRIPGDNVAVAALAGSSRVLVAQGRRLAIVDLAARQDRDGLPILDAVEAAARVRTLVSAPDEPSALALLEDGRVVAVGVDPLRVSERTAARAIAWPGVRVDAAPVAPEAPAAVAPPPDGPAPHAPPPPEAPPVVRDEPRSNPPPAPVEAPPPAPTAPAAPAAAAIESEAPAPSPADDRGEPGTVRGTVAGPERGAVRAIVLLGPDNVLKEAARVVPEPSGRWTVSGLRSGTYRVLAAGEPGRVLICDPPYVMVRVGADGAVEAPALNAMRVH